MWGGNSAGPDASEDDGLGSLFHVGQNGTASAQPVQQKFQRFWLRFTEPRVAVQSNGSESRLVLAQNAAGKHSVKLFHGCVPVFRKHCDEFFKERACAESYVGICHLRLSQFF
jgi:hypothetical protein